MDHSAPSLRAAALAGTIAGRFAAELRLLNVMGVIEAQQEDIKRYLEREHNPDPPGVAVAEQAQDALRSLGDGIAVQHGIYVACEARAGEAASEIVAAAKEHASDLVVVGHASRSLLAKAFIGSTARRVIETAPCPVLVVR